MRRLRGLLADTRPLKVPAYRRLFTAQIVTVIGAQLTVVTVPAQIYSMTGSSAYVGLTGLFGLVPLVVFGLWLGWFPIISGGKPWSDPGGRLMSLALPAINLGLVMMAYVARVTRGGMLNTLPSDFIRTARAKGVPMHRIVWKHALRNVLLAVVTFTGLYFSVLIGNSVLTEIVFNRPGLGKLVVGALDRRDYTLLQGLVVTYAVLVVVVNTLTDLLYGLVDPRVKTG